MPATQSLLNLRNKHPECFELSTKGIGKPRAGANSKYGGYSRSQNMKLAKRSLKKDV